VFSGGDGLRVGVRLPRLRFRWEANRANNWPETRPRWNRGSLDTAFYQNTIHSSVASYFTRSLSQDSTHSKTRYSHTTTTIAAEHTFAVTADPTSSPTEDSQSRAPSAQLTVIQTSHCVLLSKRGGFKQYRKSRGHCCSGKHPVNTDKAFDAYSSSSDFLYHFADLRRGQHIVLKLLLFFYSCTLATGKETSVSLTFCQAIAEACHHVRINA
jgi:hypothetical protein